MFVNLLNNKHNIYSHLENCFRGCSGLGEVEASFPVSQHPGCDISGLNPKLTVNKQKEPLACIDFIGLNCNICIYCTGNL